MVSTLESEVNEKQNLKNFIDSERYSRFKSTFPQIYSAIRDYIYDKNPETKKEVTFFKNLLEDVLNDIRGMQKKINNPEIHFPVTEDEFEQAKKSILFKTVFSQLQNLNPESPDWIHLSLCHCYASNIKEKLEFVTLDKDDILKNKTEIEQIIPLLIVETISNFSYAQTLKK